MFLRARVRVRTLNCILLVGQRTGRYLHTKAPFCFHRPLWHSGKESACQCRRWRFHPWVGKIPWSREWQLTPLFFAGKFRGQRSLAGYSSWGHKELDMTKRTQHKLSKQRQYQVESRGTKLVPNTFIGYLLFSVLYECSYFK